MIIEETFDGAGLMQSGTPMSNEPFLHLIGVAHFSIRKRTRMMKLEMQGAHAQVLANPGMADWPLWYQWTHARTKKTLTFDRLCQSQINFIARIFLDNCFKENFYIS